MAELELYNNQANAPGANLDLRWDEYLTDARIQMSSRARIWGRSVLDQVRQRLNSLNNIRGWTRARMEEVINYWSIQMLLWHMPPPPPPF
jgi:hypothetical protein